MSRKLKFRVWNGVEWLGVDEFTLWDLEHPHKGHTFQQFTGMLDKNGKEIYEGDVIRGYFDMGPAGMTINTTIVRWTNKEGYQWKYWDLNSIEVVGNIFENKDLVCDHTKYHMSVNGNCYNCGKLIFPKKPENGTPEHIKNIFKHNQ